MSVFEGVLDHGERDGWGLWFDPAVADDPIWKEYWAGVEAVVVKVAEDSIVLEVSGDASRSDAQDASRDEPNNGSGPQESTSATVEMPAASMSPTGTDGAAREPGREQGRVKWFDPEKGYGFLVRPTGEDLFVHHSEVDGDPSALEPGSDVEYVVGRNDRGPNARSVHLVD
jgi:cold shock CspA family protein